MLQTKIFNINYKKYRFIYAFCFFFVFTFLINTSGDNKVYAACGASGVGPHGYAGAVIDVVIQRSNGTRVEADGVNIIVSTMEPTSTGANIYNLNNGARLISGKFTQIANSCAGNGLGSNNVIFGYGATSQVAGGGGAQWALDCDQSRNAGGVTQKFRVTANDRPSNATPRAPGTWNEIIIDPANGTTEFRVLVYTEGPVPEDPPKPSAAGGCRAYSPNFASGATVEVGTAVRVYAESTNIPPPPPAVPTSWTGTNVPASANTRNVYFYDGYPNSSGGGTIIHHYGVNHLAVGPNGSSDPADRLNADTSTPTVPGAPRTYTYTVNHLRNVTPPPAGSPAGTASTYDWVQLGICSFSVNVIPPSPPVGSISGNCYVASIYGYDPSGATTYRLQVFHTGAGAGPIVDTFGPISAGGNSANIFLTLPPLAGSNNGYYYQLFIDDVNNLGEILSTNFVGGAFSGPCYSAVCTVSVTPIIPGTGNGVEAGKPFTVNSTLTNTGQLAVPASNARITYRDVTTGALGSVAPGASIINAPNTLTSLEFYPDYVGYFGVGPPCFTVETFKPYDIVPKANLITLLPDTENPTSVRFESNATKTAPPDADVAGINVTRVVTKNTANYKSWSSVHTFGGPQNFGDVEPVTRNLGDKYCGYITVAPAAGWIGPAGKRTDTVASRTDGVGVCNPASPTCPGGVCPPTAIVVNKPYVKAYGGDVAAGGGFAVGGSCSAPLAGIFAYMRPLSEQVPGTGPNQNKSGSGTQLASFAWGGGASSAISGFGSAMLRTSAPSATGANKLTFANSPSEPLTGTEPLLGGRLAANAPCMPDYFTNTQYSDTAKDLSGELIKVAGTGPINNGKATGPTNQNKQSLYSGDTKINPMKNYSGRHTFYVDGNVEIKDNIEYASYSNINEIPNFTIVVRGNIYIDSKVTQLDGTYIAQPRVGDPNSGKIYTCANGGSPITGATTLFASCRGPQLRVNGSFIAERVILNRSMNTLSDSTLRELSADSRAAEIFTFLPEVYLSPPVFRPNSTVTSGDYEYIATLPPIL